MSNGNNIGTIADRYAIALIELGEKSGLLDELESDLLKVNATLKSSKDLDSFLSHPTISLDDKKDVVDSIFKNSISQYTLNTIKLLLDRNRMFLFPSIVSHYVDILNKKRNLVIAKVITAVEIDEETVNKIKSKLETALNKNIKLDLQINQEIIAGMIIEIGDKVIDGSIRARLENMKKQLI